MEIQVIKCKCGKVFAACAQPECFIDKEWLKDLRKYLAGGCAVAMMDANDFRFEKCECVKTVAKQKQLNLI
jgi:hypothetical protein